MPTIVQKGTNFKTSSSHQCYLTKSRYLRTVQVRLEATLKTKDFLLVFLPSIELCYHKCVTSLAPKLNEEQ